MKYYIFLFLLLGMVLFYIFLEDPCNKLLRMDFSKEYPSYKLLDTASEEGSPAGVSCHVYYKKPGSEQRYEDIWLYQDLGGGWKLSRILDTDSKEQTP